MKFENINRKFTEKVNEYISRGYYINTGTMSCSGGQGEISHIDLTNGKEIIRILMKNFNDYERDVRGISITVGRCTDTRPNISREIGSGIWNYRLEVIETVSFFLVGKARDDREFFGTHDEAVTARDKHRERYENSCYKTRKYELPEAAKAIALKWVKRQPKCKSMKLADIDAVYSVKSFNRYTNKEEHSYTVYAKGKTYIIA